MQLNILMKIILLLQFDFPSKLGGQKVGLMLGALSVFFAHFLDQLHSSNVLRVSDIVCLRPHVVRLGR